MARGGKREGAGRRAYADMDSYCQSGRRVSKSITLSLEEWERLSGLCGGKLSEGVRELIWFFEERPPVGCPLKVLGYVRTNW